jgi:hypothetical protein
MNFTADAKPAGVTFSWKLTGNGKLTYEDQQTVRFTAPASVAAPEDVTLTVTITEQQTKCVEQETFTLQLLPKATPALNATPDATVPATSTSSNAAPDATATTVTDKPTSTSATPTPTGPPLLNIFPQAIDGENWSWANPPGLLTPQFVENSDCYVSEPYGLRLLFNFTDAGNGGWGVHWANTPTKHFDASRFKAFTFSVRGTALNGFQIGLKDTTGFEVKIDSNRFVLASDSEWRSVTVPLDTFTHQGQQVNIASVENVNFGFHSGHGSGDICIDDIAFIE